LVLALYPITFIWNLQVNLRIKIGLAVIMGLGVVATIASVFKTVELKNLATMDFTWNATNLVYWYMAENWIIIIAACVPTLKPLYQKFSGKSTTYSGRGNGSGSGRSLFRTFFGSKASQNASGASKSGSNFTHPYKETSNSMDAIVLHETEMPATGKGGIMVRRDVDIV
jgi:hypothetical protein